jgi:hypothetical protein
MLGSTHVLGLMYGLREKYMLLAKTVSIVIEGEV